MLFPINMVEVSDGIFKKAFTHRTPEPSLVLLAGTITNNFTLISGCI